MNGGFGVCLYLPVVVLFVVVVATSSKQTTTTTSKFKEAGEQVCHLCKYLDPLYGNMVVVVCAWLCVYLYGRIHCNKTEPWRHASYALATFAACCCL